MIAFADWLTPLYLIVLCAFVAVTSTLMLLTVLNRLRVRGIEMAWRRGRAVAPMLFLVVASALMTLAAWHGQQLEATVLVGYCCGGAFWLVAAALARAVLVTERGVIGHVNRPRRAFAWSQVADYARQPTADNGQQYVFFVREGGAHRRVELCVPAAHVGAFQERVAQHVDARFEERVHAAYGRAALEE